MTEHPAMTPGDHMMHLGESDPTRRSGMVNLEVLQGAPDWDRLVETFERVSRTVPRFRQKVVVPTLPTTAPRWVTDPDFDINYHMRRVRAPEPGTMRQLLDLADSIAQSPLDLARPLWTVTLVEGLEGGRSALVDHLSHVITDGVGGVAMAMELYDLSEKGEPRVMPPVPTPADMSPNDLMKQGLRDLPTTSIRSATGLARFGIRTATHPAKAVGFIKSLGRVLASGSTEPSPLLRRRGIGRRTITLQVDLAALKAAGKKHGGSVNDAYVTSVTVGMRNYHEALGVHVESIPMAVPISIRAAGDSMEGNAFTGVFLAAPVAGDDLAAKVQSIGSQIRSAKQEPAVDLMGILAPVVVRLPMLVLGEFMDSFKAADVQASNVPSYPVPTWICGQPVVAQYGLGPLPGVAMMATMISRNGVCHVAFRYDTASFENPELLQAALRDAFVEFIGDDTAVSAIDAELAPKAVK